jgi:hypothetical protein
MNAITPISEARLMSLAPSVFASAAHSSRSARYGYVNSIDLIRALVEKGFDVTDARQSKARSEDKRDFTKHVVRLRHLDSYKRTLALFAEGKELYRDTHTAEARAAARSIPGYGEVVLTNSHDGSSAVVLHGGILRPDCFNGLYVSDSMIASIHVTHSIRLVANVIDGAFAVAEQLPKALDVIGDWRNIQLEAPEQLAFAKAAHAMRFADAEGNIATGVQPQRLLEARRDADKPGDLWTVMNRVQENVIRGGLNDFRPSKFNRETNRIVPAKRLRTRAIKGIDQDVRLNKGLWTLAEEMAKLKVAA